MYNLMEQEQRAQPVVPERPRPVPPALVASLRAEFQALVDGKLEDNLIQIERLAARARELCGVISGLDQRVHVRGGQLGEYNSNSYGVSYGVGAIPLPASSNPEQFGASAIRQLVNSAPDVAARFAEAFSNSPARQVEAIATARSRGLSSLADKLEARLLSSSAAHNDAGHSDEQPPHANGSGDTRGPVVHAPAAIGAGG